MHCIMHIPFDAVAGVSVAQHICRQNTMQMQKYTLTVTHETNIYRDNEKKLKLQLVQRVQTKQEINTTKI